MEFTLITGRTLRQGLSRDHLKLEKEYMKAAAICEIDKEDFERLGVKEWTPIRVTSEHGSVVVYAVKSSNSHKGIVFMPMGPWANKLIGANTDSTGMPTFKGIKVKVEPVPNEKVPDPIEVLLDE